MNVKLVIFDLDQTLIDTSCALFDRKNRNWQLVYSKMPNMKVFDGIMEVIGYLDDNGIPFCVVTSSPEVYCRKVLEYFRISPKFSITYYDVARRKPDPESLYLAMRKLNIDKPSEVLHIGDDAKDVLASKAAGTRIIGVTWGNRDNSLLIDSDPEFLVDFPWQIMQILDEEA